MEADWTLHAVCGLDARPDEAGEMNREKVGWEDGGEGAERLAGGRV